MTPWLPLRNNNQNQIQHQIQAQVHSTSLGFYEHSTACLEGTVADIYYTRGTIVPRLIQIQWLTDQGSIVNYFVGFFVNLLVSFCLLSPSVTF